MKKIHAAVLCDQSEARSIVIVNSSVRALHSPCCPSCCLLLPCVINIRPIFPVSLLQQYVSSVLYMSILKI